MGVSLSIPFDPCVNKVSKWLDEKGGYTHNLKKNLAALETSLEDLKAKRDDLSRRVTREEDKGLRRLSEIQVWLTRVETVEQKVNDLLSARNEVLQRLCLCGFCSKSLISSYRYGKKVFLTLREVENLKYSGDFEMISEQVQTTSEVEERPLQPIIVGQKPMLEKAWNHLMDDEVGIMGMYGMGGVGKTTLLAQINNGFSNVRCGFDFVIWVVVSKELHVEKIQDEIAQKVGLGGDEWKQKEKSQKADVIYNFLRKKIFVLFLDDIWEKIDLAEIGVPFPTTHNGCKVAFTTRSQDVCAHMGVEDPMEVQCLADDDAFNLFQKKVGQITLRSDPEIPELARIVAKKCCGLPLALNVIGETMACKRTMHEWQHAIDVLSSYAREFSGMKDKILPLLKYSYDNLKGEQAKSCLLYCALFPEDYEIPKEKLIGYWICEGIIDGSEGIERAENKGYEIIGSLVRASLLMEKVGWDETNSLCIHDVVREMALWIASDLGVQKGAFIVHAGVGLQKMPKVSNWDVVRRMSLMNNKIHFLDGSPKCVELTTLLLQKMNLANISSEFFKSMPKLVVLDLSDNKCLFKLPDGISELVSLQYLDLSKTSIYHFPLALQKLNKLIYLDLEETSKLRSIAGISSLHNLKVLKLYRSGFSWDVDKVVELETLEHLEFLTLGFHLQERGYFLNSDRLTSCTRALTIRESYRQSSVLALPVTMEKLHYFFIGNCSISEIRICINSKMVSPLQNPRNPCFLSLSIVLIAECKFLRDLTWLMFAPNLKSLSVFYSNQLENIIKRDKAFEGKRLGIVPFLKLNHLKLKRLPNLRSIYESPLPFPCLKRIDVIYCPNLKKLPLNSKSCKGGENGLIIRYSEKEWIDDVKWEDKATETRFLLSYQQPRGLMGFD